MTNIRIVTATAVLFLGSALFGAVPSKQGRGQEHDHGRDSHQVQRDRGQVRQQDRGGWEGNRGGERRQYRPTPEELRVQRREQQRSWAQHFARRGDDRRDWRERGGYRGERIPDREYRERFGREHAFRVYDQPFMVVGGAPRFQFQGYWFGLMAPVPTYWGRDWYRRDQVYVVYRSGGYYLVNRRYPSRPGIAITVVF